MINDQKCNIVVGFYGDEIQNIYGNRDDTINEMIKENKIECIYKKYNRRCSLQVINISKKVYILIMMMEKLK